MKVRLAHISDLHFGRVEELLVEGLLRQLRKAAPDLVVVSGDLTQRARRREFRAARRFLERLPCDWLAVPGNHDIPAYDLVARFWHPYRRYRRYISPRMMPLWRRQGVAVVGVNSARRMSLSLNWADGRVSRRQMAAAARLLETGAETTHRIVVAHHPFLKLTEEEGEIHKLVGRHRMATSALKEAEVDLILAGHLHRSFHGQLRLDEAGRRLFVVQAGTATSNRLRGEANAFHLIDLEPGVIRVHAREWREGRFRRTETLQLVRDADGHWEVAAGREPEALDSEG